MTPVMSYSRISEHRKALLSSPRITTVIVGPQDKSKAFAVHTSLLRHTCSYFDAAYRSGRKESTTDVFKLDEDDPDTWETMQIWLYQQEVYVRPMVTAYSEGWCKEYHTERHFFAKCFALYILADTLLCPRLQDDLITVLTTRLMKNGTFFPSMQAVSSTLQRLPDTSPLLRFIARAAAMKLDAKTFAYYESKTFTFSARFDEELVKSRREVVSSVSGYSSLWACHYHSHGYGADCPGKMISYTREAV